MIHDHYYHDQTSSSSSGWKPSSLRVFPAGEGEVSVPQMICGASCHTELDTGDSTVLVSDCTIFYCRVFHSFKVLVGWEYTTKHEVKGLLISSPQESSHLQKRKWLIEMLLDAVNCSSQARNTFNDILSSIIRFSISGILDILPQVIFVRNWR